MENHFVLRPEDYKRDLNVVGHYVKDAATYLHKRTGKSLEACRAFVEQRIKEDGAIVDPPTLTLERNVHGDRQKTFVPLTEYIRDVEMNNRIISPTMAVYQNATVAKSITADFIEENIARRKRSKGEMFAAKTAGNKSLETFKDNEQSSFKISNNSLSGAQASTSTILYNKSAHSSLTSTCRTATSYGNANNEKFLYGNRHYWSPDIVKGNIISIVNSTDYTLVEKALETYGIRHPSVEETMECIQYSTDLYWKNPEKIADIQLLVSSLTDLERSAFVYIGDLYHLAKYNDHLVRNLLEELSSKATQGISNPDEYIKSMDDDMMAFVNLLCTKETVGKKQADIRKYHPEDYAILGATAKQVKETLDRYQWLIKAFWRANTLPASVAHIRSSIRRGVITSDTDSTIFTVQDWVKWHVGEVNFTEKANAISYAVVYLATQTITHLLAKVSAGMGVQEKYMHTLAMKNEFAFPVFVLTSMAKHYFAYISAQEGNVFENYGVEVKGVYLKDSNAPPHVMEEFNKTLRWTMDKVIEGKGLNVTELMQKVARIEKEVNESVRKGNTFYLAKGQVKDHDSYKNPATSPFVFYGMWQSVFAEVYGEAPEPPYAAVKVSVNLNNRTKIEAWLNGMTDQRVAARMREWMTKNNKTTITSFLLPKALVEFKGLPEEVISAMNIRKLIYTTTKPFYFLLEALGIYVINDNLTKLISDTVSIDE